MKRWIVFLMAITFVACGVKFNDAPINLVMPDYFKERNLLDRTEIWRHKLPELVGSIVYLQSDGSYSRHRRIVKEGYVANLELVEDPERKVYSSRIDRGAAAEGSYLVFAADLEVSQMAEVNIEDVSLVFINDADVPWEEIYAEANAQAPSTDIRRYWIQGALLTHITIDYYTKISSNASGVVGDTFGAKGNVYNKQGTTSRDFMISLELYDLDGVQTTSDPIIHALSPDARRTRIKTILKEAHVKKLRLNIIRD